MLRGFNHWNIKEYSKWYHYLWLMPVLTVWLAYGRFLDKVYDLLEVCARFLQRKRG